MVKGMVIVSGAPATSGFFTLIFTVLTALDQSIQFTSPATRTLGVMR
jgi:hypothetical protein